MKKILAFLLVAVLLISAAGCGSLVEEKENLTQEVFHTDIPGVEIRAAGFSADGENYTLHIVWRNQTGYQVIYGEPYTIERWDGSQWISCAKQKENVFLTIGYGLEPGKEAAKNYRISDLFDVSKPGKYRFTSNCHVYTGGKRETCRLWVEFMIDGARKPEKTGGVTQWTSPPEAKLIFPDGERTLSAAGYQWTYESGDGTVCAVIADQAGRPPEQHSMEAAVIDKGHDPIGYPLKLEWEAVPASVTYTCWPEAVWQKSNTPEEAVVSCQDFAFYAKTGGYIYEIAAIWDDTGAGYHGTANYYVYIIGRNEASQ